MRNRVLQFFLMLLMLLLLLLLLLLLRLMSLYKCSSTCLHHAGFLFPFFSQFNHLSFYTFLFSHWDFLFPACNRQVKCTLFVSCAFSLQHMNKKKYTEYLELFAVTLAKCVDDATAIIVHDDGGRMSSKENTRRRDRLWSS